MSSTVIKSYKYLSGAKALLITFISGKMYQYSGVGKAQYDEFRKAFSKGIYFNKYIKPFYPFKQLAS